jgi:hypothetical protein
VSDVVAGEASRSTEKATGKDQAPGPAALVLRPFGYLGMTAVWTALWLIALAIPAGTLAYLAFDDPEAVVGNLSQRFANPVEAIAMVVFLVPLIALIMGPGAIFHLPFMCWPLAVLSLTYTLRALRPSYAGEKLSFTTYQARGESIGPPTVGDLALSLQPVRSTGFTDAVMRFYIAGWSLDGPMFKAMLPVGAAWSFLVPVVVPGFDPTLRVVCLGVAVVLTFVSLVLGVRAFRGRFFPA